MTSPTGDWTVRAYAKINLGLRVTEKRPDGYHTIETIFHRVDLWDELLLAPADQVVLTCSDPSIPEDESNICHKAARLLQHHYGTDTGVACRLMKNIPAGAGLGGGSADCAAMLQGLPLLWGRAIDQNALVSLALQLGSDVPYFLGTGSAVGRGRGEILEYFMLDIPYAILLCYPNIHVPTAWAYRQIRPRGGPEINLRSLVLEGMKEPDLLRKYLVNDFESPVFAAFPDIRAVKDAMESNGAAFASMSGSGSSVYGLFRDMHSAEHLAARFRARGYRAFITPLHFGV